MAAMPNKIVQGGSNELGGEVVAVHAPIYSKSPNVRGEESPRVRLPAGKKMALDKGLGSQALDLVARGFRRFNIAGGYAVSAKRRRLPSFKSRKKERVYLEGASAFSTLWNWVRVRVAILVGR